jgi:transcriptional regulator with XRE-family HTH domain
MTQQDIGGGPFEGRETLSPSAALARRLKELRAAHRWSAQDVANRCAEVGMPQLNRTVISNLENPRKHRAVTLEEAFVLAYVLDVAPIYLFLPVDLSDTLVTPKVVAPTGRAREWVRGRYALAGQDVQEYWTRRPEQEWIADREQSMRWEQWRQFEAEGGRVVTAREAFELSRSPASLTEHVKIASDSDDVDAYRAWRDHRGGDPEPWRDDARELVVESGPAIQDEP